MVLKSLQKIILSLFLSFKNVLLRTKYVQNARNGASHTGKICSGQFSVFNRCYKANNIGKFGEKIIFQLNKSVKLNFQHLTQKLMDIQEIFVE